MSRHILHEHLPSLLDLLSIENNTVPAPLTSILDMAYSFSRMLHGSKAGSGGKMDAFYRAFVPDLGSLLDPRQVELVKRCVKSERHEADRVGACVFPGLVKITGAIGNTPVSPGIEGSNQTVVKRAQVVCECAMGIGGPPPAAAASASFDRQSLASSAGHFAPNYHSAPQYDRQSVVSSPAMSTSALSNNHYAPPPPMP